MAGLYEMQYILPDIVKHLDAGVPCMLATVLYAKGPAPRSTGASMLVDPAGSQYGKIGCGLAEYVAIELAERIISSGESAASDLPSAAVKACGPDANRSGCIHVLLDRIGPEDADCVTTGDLVTRFCKAWNRTKTEEEPEPEPGKRQPEQRLHREAR